MILAPGNLFRQVGLASLALIYPHYCPSCRQEWTGGKGWICNECWKMLTSPQDGLWHNLPELRRRIVVAFSYAGIMVDLVHQMKFSGRTDIAATLGTEAALRIKDQPGVKECSAVIPVPLHPIRIRERGYDQNLVIARNVAGVLNLPLLPHLLRRTRNTPPQSRLSDRERRKSLQDAFEPIASNVSYHEAKMLLIDDVIHTGATAKGCIAALNRIGIRDVMTLAACG